MARRSEADSRKRTPLNLSGIIRIAPFVLLTLFSIPLLWPLLQKYTFCTHDGNLHFYRLVALRHSIEQGLVFSRWTPGLVFGYGFPFFNFREVFSYYAPEAVHLLGLSIPTALDVVYAFGLVLSGWGAYLLARDIWKDQKAGLIAGMAYMAAPYQMLDVYVRGNLPESMALAFFPIILWLFRRLVLAPRRLTFIASVLVLATLLLTHNISSLLFIPMLIVYLVFVLLIEKRHAPLCTGWILAGKAALLAILLTCFAWLPALLEKDSVQLYLTHATRGNDFHYNFTTLERLLAPTTTSDPTLLNPPIQVPIGLPQLFLGVAGLWGAFGFRDRTRRGYVLFMVAIAAGLYLLALPVSTPLWEKLPFIRFVQFPWRLVGRAALPLALLAGAPLALVPRRFSLATVAILTTVISLAAFPWLYPAKCSYPESPNIGDVMRFERNTGLTGVDPLGAYLPRWVIERPSNSPMEAALEQGTIPRRFDLTTLPKGAVLLAESYGPNRATIELDTPSAFTAVYHTFYFPGWTVQIDGEPIAIDPIPETGLISFEVPQGSHLLTIRWRLTALRSLAGTISLLALVGVAIIWLTGRRKIGRFGNWESAKVPTTNERGHHRDFLERPVHLSTLFLLALLLLAAKLFLVDAGKTPLRQVGWDQNQLASLEEQTRIHFADNLEMIGSRSEPAIAGAELRIDLAWSVSAVPEGIYESRIALVDGDGYTWSAKETYRPWDYQRYPPTTQWQPDRWAWDSHSIPILPGTPAGTYQLRLTVFERKSLEPLNHLDAMGNVVGPDAIIGNVQIERPSPGSISAEVLKMQHSGFSLWDNLWLLGWNLDRKEASPGDPILISLFWQAEERLPRRSMELTLLDADSVPVRIWSRPLVRNDLPTDNWEKADPLMGQHLLFVPGTTLDGPYTWQLTMIDSEGIPLDPPISLGRLDIKGPDRNWEAPMVVHSTEIEYDEFDGNAFTRLAGYDLSQNERQIDIQLIWQALSETETGYRVFVHLLGKDGYPVSQSDGIPANWSRPTTGWAPGEYITDPHTLAVPIDLPPGDYALSVGLYDFETGERLTPSEDLLTTLRIP